MTLMVDPHDASELPLGEVVGLSFVLQCDTGLLVSSCICVFVIRPWDLSALSMGKMAPTGMG